MEVGRFKSSFRDLFFARVSLSRLFIWCFLSAGVLILAFAEPYRLERLLTFLDPWADPLDSGWQLTQALIAFAVVVGSALDWVIVFKKPFIT